MGGGMHNYKCHVSAAADLQCSAKKGGINWSFSIHVLIEH